MKSAPIVILALAVGLVGGYVIRDSTVDEVAPRGGDRRAESTKLPVLPDTTLAEAPDVVPDQTGSARIDPGEEEAHAACGEGESAATDSEKEEENPLAGLLKGSEGMIKTMMESEARNKALEIAEALGLDEERTKLLEEAMAKEASRALNTGLGALLEGKEPTAEELAALDKPDGLMTQALEQDLSEFLNGHEIDQVRDEMRKEKERKEIKRIEDKVEDLGVTDLRDDQREQLRQHFKQRTAPDRSKQKEQFSKLFKRGKGNDGAAELSTDDLMKQIEADHAAEREQVARILDDKQLKQYDRTKKQEMEQTKMGLKFFGGMFKGAKGAAPKMKFSFTPPAAEKEEK